MRAAIKSRILASILPASLAVMGLFGQTDWPSYSHDQAGQRYSPLAQINPGNVSKLKLVWQYGIDPGSISLDASTRRIDVYRSGTHYGRRRPLRTHAPSRYRGARSGDRQRDLEI